MKKIISFAVLSLLCSLNSGGACTDGLLVGGYTWGCGLGEKKMKQVVNAVGYGKIVQTVGSASRYCVGGAEQSAYGTNFSFRCDDASGSDDTWSGNPPRFHPDSPIKGQYAQNAFFELYKSDMRTHSGFSTDKPGATLDGYLYVTCKDSYTPKSGACVSVGSNAKCAVKNTKHPGITCNTSGGTNCLQAGNDGFLYCYAKEDYRKNVIADLQNSCQPTVNIVTIAEKPGSYFTCTHDGKWQETKFSRCESGDDFPGGCNDRPGCEDVANSPASSQAQTNATSVTQVWASVAPETFCMVSRCKSGYTKQGDKCLSQDQVKQAQQRAQRTEELKDKCKSTLGTWNGSKCTCKIKDTVLRNNECVCKNSVYELDIEDKKCKLKPEYKNEQELCESSHGSWDVDKCTCDKEKLLRYNPTDKVCVCDGDDYVYNPEQQKCVLTDIAVRRNACNAASGTEWIESEGRCNCTESGKLWNQTMCVYSDDFTKCAGVSGATWDTTGNKCICASNDKELKDWQCVDTQETIAKGVINTSFPKFESLVSGLEVNKWKSADGTFNVARLASDSIAGAVLGTASGLITSSVVKKNQVKKGFENVRCVVGNQVVAGYGDEFTVGAQ